MVSDEEIVAAVRGAPTWITPAIMRETLNTFQPYYKERLSAGDALEILINAGELFHLLFEDSKDQPDVIRT